MTFTGGPFDLRDGTLGAEDGILTLTASQIWSEGSVFSSSSKTTTRAVCRMPDTGFLIDEITFTRVTPPAPADLTGIWKVDGFTGSGPGLGGVTGGGSSSFFDADTGAFTLDDIWLTLDVDDGCSGRLTVFVRPPGDDGLRGPRIDGEGLFSQ